MLLLLLLLFLTFVVVVVVVVVFVVVAVVVVIVAVVLAVVVVVAAVVITLCRNGFPACTIKQELSLELQGLVVKPHVMSRGRCWNMYFTTNSFLTISCRSKN